MTTTTSLIAERLSSLPIDSAARREALHYVNAGETLAQVFVSVAEWLNGSPSLKPGYPA